MGDEAIRIGICDDHPIFRAGLRDLVRDERDLDLVFEAGTLAELDSALRASTIELLLLDVGLPDGLGVDAVRALSARTRVLVISAHADPRMIRHALEEGALGFVRKDAPATDVLRSIRRAAAGQTVLAADLALDLARALRGDPESRDLHARVAALTARQREVLALVAEGRSNREIASAMYIGEGTVKNHVSQILQTLDVPDRTRLALLVARHRLVP